MATTNKLISSVTVGSGGAANMEFTSIPATYTDLLVRISSRLDTGADSNVFVYFNNDTTAANYSFINLQGISTSVLTEASSNARWANGVYSDYTANVFSNNNIYIPNYTSSNQKSVSYDGTLENNNAVSILRLLAGKWTGTSAITSIKLDSVQGSFVQYSTAYLYGISNA